MGHNERLIYEDWTIMIFLPFFEEKHRQLFLEYPVLEQHRQLFLEYPVLEQLLTTLFACLLWTSNEAPHSFLSLSFRDMG